MTPNSIPIRSKSVSLVAAIATAFLFLWAIATTTTALAFAPKSTCRPLAFHRHGGFHGSVAGFGTAAATATTATTTTTTTTGSRRAVHYPGAWGVVSPRRSSSSPTKLSAWFNNGQDQILEAIKASSADLRAELIGAINTTSAELHAEIKKIEKSRKEDRNDLNKNLSNLGGEVAAVKHQLELVRDDANALKTAVEDGNEEMMKELKDVKKEMKNEVGEVKLSVLTAKAETKIEIANLTRVAYIVPVLIFLASLFQNSGGSK